MLKLFSNKYFILMILALVALMLVGREMKKWLPSKEVVNFEFLQNSENAERLINSAEWQQLDDDGFNKTTRLKNNTRWDFLYILSYSSLLIFLCRLILGTQDSRIRKMTLLIYGSAAADIVENIFLLSILNGSRSFYPTLMTAFASIKFLLLIALVIWLIVVSINKMILIFKK